ncbi:copper resistance protein [Tardiphaga alba]|uniref:Copper resistance protein n=1 Tax=Tardiphaga alba TaxID=340268 RepID=A0ABX8AD88_9BRAD|nr:cupredoxin family protein [Tardiphaga alba]QUS39785.1 copper resistance protein [Tardiphaga alba]
MTKVVLSAAIAAVMAVSTTLPAFADARHGHHGHHDSTVAFGAGEPGDPKRPSRTVNVAMNEVDGRMLFVPSKVEVRKGEQVKFVLRNVGAIEHEFVLATTKENLAHAEEMKSGAMQHNDPNAKMLDPKKTGEIVWKFSKAGEFEYACLIPGHREAGMVGTVVVK